MKTLLELCNPRESVFEETKRDDVLDLTDLVENRVNPAEFFEENFLTQGMKVLFETAFKRFHRQGATGVIKLTQSMGGGKTHNMIALSLLARHPEYREKVMGDFFKNSYVGKIKVVAFTGRESDAPYGIWGSIAEQLGKKDVFKDYYSPLQAPGQTAWINLLKGEPLLILLDELPPYLENARSKPIGDSNLAVVTTTALANLFNALGKEELCNICLVISDLKATYESGSELLQSSFKNLEDEVSRLALNIEPVGSTSDEVYYILKKRLFKESPEASEINEIANAYKKAIVEARQMGYTNISPEQIFVGVKDSYPFHPSIKDLYARFKENPGFQQTRGLIRLMRVIVSQLYNRVNPGAREKYLVNVYDFDLNHPEMLTTITQIKPSLVNAIAHDIAANGKAIAEVVDASLNETCMQELARLILVSSLADVPNALLGLSLPETVGFLCEPGKDITRVKKALDEFVMQAWYLYTDRDGRLYFKNTKNLIAELNSLVDSYDNESARKELRVFLEEKFKPSLGDCYQRVQVFPAVDEISLAEDKVLLVLFEPYPEGSDLHPDLRKFYENERYKNRVMFLSGSRSTMDKLLRVAKEHKAINVIIGRMEEEKVPANNTQYQKALEKRDRTNLELLQAARETFMQLYYPTKNGLLKADFLMEFTGNNYNGEKQVKDVLMRKAKFTAEVTDDSFRKKCEDRLFTQKEMRWNDVKERAATNPVWQWHIPRALDDLKEEILKKDIWREHGGYIEKPPFPKEKTGVLIQELRRDDNTGEVALKLIPQYGDRVYYEIGASATAASNPVENVNEFKTRELKLSFLCVDSRGGYVTGGPVEWKNKITLKYRIYDRGEDKVVELKSAPPVSIRYTTDGSNPKEYGGIYDGEFTIPKSSTFVLAVAEASDRQDACSTSGIYSEVLQVKIDRTKGVTVTIDKERSLKLNKRCKTSDTAETYQELDLLKKRNARLSDVIVTFYKVEESSGEKGWVELTLDSSLNIDLEKLENSMDNVRSNFMAQGKVNICLEYGTVRFNTGQDFLDWVTEKKMVLKDFKEQEIVQ
ncbi:MAG TPA: glycosyl transferase [Desulfotomaculum sp.]|nr:glycosyl transferase [Desulfotomaculum sp.]